MKRLLSLLLVFGCLVAKGQTNVDSLRSVWANTKLPDTVRLAAIHKIAWDTYSNSNPDSSFAYAQVQLEFAIAQGNLKYQGYALNTLGGYHMKRGENDSATMYHLKCLAIQKEIGSPDGIGMSLGNLAVIEKNLGNYKKAEVYYQEALGFYDSPEYVEGKALTLSNLGNLRLAESLYDEALVFYRAALNIQDSIGDMKGAAITLNGIGQIHNQCGDYAEGVRDLLRSAFLFKEIGHISGQATVLHNVGRAYGIQKDYDMARNYYDSSLVVFSGIGSRLGMAANLNAIGLIFLNSDEQDKAIGFFRKAFDEYDGADNRQGMGSALSNMGMSYTQMDSLDKASKLFSKAVDIQMEIGDRMGVLRSQHGLGKVFLKQKKVNEAVTILKEALVDAKSLNLISETKDISYDLSLAFKDQGEYSEAWNALMTFVVTDDSLLAEENRSSLAEQEYTKRITAQLRNRELELTNQVLELDKKQLRSTQLILVLAICAAVIIIMLVGYIWIKDKKRAKEIEKDLNNQLTKIKNRLISRSQNSSVSVSIEALKTIDKFLEKPLSETHRLILILFDQQGTEITKKEIAKEIPYLDDSATGVHSALKSMYKRLEIDDVPKYLKRKAALKRALELIEEASVSKAA